MSVATGVMRMTVSELCEHEGVPTTVLVTLVEYDIAHPVAGAGPDDWMFDTNAVIWLKKAIRLQRDLDLDWLAVASLVDLLREREQLARENQALRQRLARFLADD